MRHWLGAGVVVRLLGHGAGSLGLPLLFTLGLAAIGAKAKASDLTLALNWKAEAQFGGFYAAERLGAYKAHGLNVKIIEGGSGTPTVQMLAAGKIPFAIVSADELVTARARGADVVALFAVYQKNPQGIMTHAASGFNKLEDLYRSKHTLALQAGLPYAAFLQKKFPGSTVKIVPHAGGIGSFLNDSNFAQQCFVTSEPLLAKAKGKDVKVFLVADEGFNPYTTVLATYGAYLAKNEAQVLSLVKAVRLGWSDYLSQPEPTNEVMAGLNKGIDRAGFSASAAAQKPLIATEETQKHGLGYMSEVRWQELSEQLLAMKLIDKKPELAGMFRWYADNGKPAK